MNNEVIPPKSNALENRIQWMQYAALGVICTLVIGIFAWSARPGILEFETGRVNDSYYNLLVEGFRSGQLNVKREAPAALASLSNPYDPALNFEIVWAQSDPCYEMSYYKGKLYLYFGVTPAVVLFWPYAALTGHYLATSTAVVIFFSIGFLIAAGLINALWRRYFPDISVWIAVLGILAFGLCTGVLEILSSCDVYEVAKSCGFMFAMIALAGIWRALHEPIYKIRWLILAGLAYGLAIGSRPTLLYAAIILIIPAVQAWFTAGPGLRWRIALLFLAATVPLALVGVGLMVYNFLRFDNPFEFGWHYQLTNIDQHYAGRQFNLHYLWYNFRFYFLEPMRWAGGFPYLQGFPLPPAPSGHGGIGATYSGILLDYPIIWLALAVPIAWKTGGGKKSVLHWFAAALFLLFGSCALTMCLFLIVSSRYQFDFLPALMLLAVIGIFGLERALAGLPVWRRATRCGWGLLLAYTFVFSALAAFGAQATNNYFIGNSFLNRGASNMAVEYFRKALEIEPNSAETHYGLGDALHQEGQIDDAIIQFQEAAALKPDDGDTHYNLAHCLMQEGQLDDAIVQCQKAADLKPGNGVYHTLFGNIFLQKKQFDQAIAQYHKALEINPDNAEAHNNLAYAFFMKGQIDEAIGEYQEAIKYSPKDAAYYFNLGDAYRHKQMPAQAMTAYQKAIDLNPDFLPAEASMAWILATWPDASVRNGQQAVALAETACQLCRNSDPLVLRTLAAAYAETGNFSSAITAAKMGLALAARQSNLNLVRELQDEIGLYETNSPCRTIAY